MPEIDFSYTPGAANSFARQFDASRQNRMAAEEQQSNLDQLKSDRQAMVQLQDQLRAAGKDTDLNKVFDALINTGKPDYVMHGIEGKQRLKAQMDFERTGRDLYPELFGGGAAAAVPQPAPPAPQPPAAPALGSGMFGTGVSMNALAPTAAAAAPTTNALAPTAAAPTNAMAKTPEQLRREIMFFSQSSDPRAKAMVGALTSQLSEITKPYVVGGNLVTGAGQTLFTAPPTPRASQLRTPEEEAQAIRIAAGSRPPPEPKDDPRLVVANTITDAAGNVTQYNRFGEPIGDVKKGAGKPSATYEKTKALQKQMGVDLDRAITELETITKPGGLIEQSTGSGIGRAADVTAGFFGTATPGAIAIGKLKPIADLALKMVPRFEGPQSDKDTQSYKEAAGQLADASLPTGIRSAAAKEVLRLMKSRRAQFVTPEMAVEGLSPISQGGASGSFDVPPDIQAILDKNKPKAR